MAEAIIKTNFGEIRIPYNNTNELKEALEQIEEQIRILSDATEMIAPLESRAPKPGFEKLYRFLGNGTVELFHYPQTLLHIVILALFAYQPETVTAQKLEETTNIKDVVGKVVGQTKNKDYFRKVGDTYGLSPEGVQLFIEKIKPLIDGNLEKPKNEGLVS